MDRGSDRLTQPIDDATLASMVQRALDRNTVEVTNWDVQQIHGGWGHGSAGGSGIHRVSGQGRDGAELVEWSLILKVLHPPADQGQPTDFTYWRREADAYQSGLLDDLPGGLAAPRCFGVVDQPDGECRIWMEDVTDDIGPQWPLEHYGVVARHLGQFNGAYLTGQQPVPSYPWLRHKSWLRANVARRAPDLTQVYDALDNPLVRRAYPPDVLDSLSRRWAKGVQHQDQFLCKLDRLPQTLCHSDAFRLNLFARRAPDGLEQTVAIDWAVVGIGWIGREIDMLTSSTLLFREVDYSDAKELDRIVFKGYLDGLRDAGWRGDPRQVRFGQVAHSAMPSIGMLRFLLTESQYARIEQITGLSMTQIADEIAEHRRRPPLTWEEEAWELLDGL